MCSPGWRPGRVLGFCVVIAATLGVPASPASAQPLDPLTLRRALADMLAAAWDPSPDAKIELENAYASWQGSADWRIDYAYALAKMRQWDYAEATEIARQLATHPATDPAADPAAELPARTMHAWLLLLQKKYAAGLAELELVIAALPAGDDLTPAERARREESIRLVGRMFGYLATPVEQKLSEFERASRRRRIARLLSEEELAWFDQESQAVAEQFLTRVDAKDRIVEEARQKAEEDRARRLDEITAQKRAAADRLDELEKQHAEAQDELQEKLREFEDRDAPLRERYASLDAEAAVVNRNLAYTNADMLRIDEQLHFESDPVLRNLLINDLARLQSLASSYSRNLTQIESAAAGVQRERRLIANEQRQVETRYRSVMAAAVAEQQTLVRETRRSENEEKRLLREKPRTSGQARALTAQATAFTTYVPFPYEDARRRLLASFMP